MPRSIKKKTVKAWAILLQYEKDPSYIFGIYKDRKDVAELYCHNSLYKPNYRIIPIEVVYSLPKNVTKGKK